MMGLLSTIFGSGSVIKDGMELIDKMHTSDAEEIEAKTAAKTALFQAYAPFKLAQRVIAFAFTAVYLLAFFTVAGGTVYELGFNLDSLRGVISEFMIGEIMLVIVLFYFGGGAFEGGANAILNRKKGQSK